MAAPNGAERLQRVRGRERALAELLAVPGQEVIGGVILGGATFCSLIGTVVVMAWNDRQARLRQERRLRDRYIHI